DKNISILKNEGASYASAAFQDYAKYSLTLKENIVFENDTADEDIINLLYKVDFSKKELDNLPNGLQTFLNREYDEDGIVLSEGQWQRVAVARAFCHNMPLIILDEPTSSLDPVSEENLYNVINTIKGEKTVIMVSHRLSGVISSDKIFVIDNGMIAGAGTHNELMKKCEIYNKMFNLQANRYLQIH
ncbi:MAG: ABC transporter ATP-binding protein/permease, partial [Treponema sp.]|nr:ABC transporter ATP-binding protein/permease [Treponema sp.]